MSSTAARSQSPEGLASIKPLSRRPWLPRPPVSLTPLIGRESEVGVALSLLRRGDIRLLTFTGPGGIGKTRLATEIAALVATDFADGVGWVSLAAVRDPTLVVPAIARALGLIDTHAQSMADVVVTALRSQQALLVLDNFEQVIDAAPDVAELLANCPALKVLVTSRALLRIRGEHALPVPPLALPAVDCSDPTALFESAAVRLFVERAQAASPVYDMTPALTSQVAEICRRLDGLPLAIELAAARITHLDLPTLSARMERRLPLLTGGARDLPARLRTMRDAVAWSYDLLDPEEQALFRRLAVFADGFDLAAAAIARDADDPVSRSDEGLLDGLGSLVDMSLVLHDSAATGGPRYAMLEVIREYGQEALAASGEEDPTRRRHALWYLAFVREMRDRYYTAEELPAMDRLAVEHANLGAALRWFLDNDENEAGLEMSAALAWYWHARGPLVPGMEFLETFLSRTAHATPLTRADALTYAGLLRWSVGNYATAQDAFDEALEIWRRLDHPLGIVRTLNFVSLITASRQDLAGSVTVNEEALAIARDAGDKFWIAATLAGLGRALIRSGDAARALPLLQEAVRLHSETGYERGKGWALEALADEALLRGAAAEAAAYFQEATFLPLKWRDLRTVAHTLPRLAAAVAAIGQPERAASLLGATATLWQSTGLSTEHEPTSGYAHTAAAIRDTLGDQRFEAAFAEGRAFPLEQAIAEALAPLTNRQAAASGPLTRRERDVLRLLAEGKTDREIAEELFIGLRTVESHVSRIFEKLGVRNRVAAATAAQAAGLLEPPPEDTARGR